MGGPEKQRVAGYIDCGVDSDGRQLVITLAGVLLIDVRPHPDGLNPLEVVTLTLPTKKSR